MSKEMTIEEAVENLEPIVEAGFLRDYEKQSLKFLIQHAKEVKTSQGYNIRELLLKYEAFHNGQSELKVKPRINKMMVDEFLRAEEVKPYRNNVIEDWLNENGSPEIEQQVKEQAEEIKPSSWVRVEDRLPEKMANKEETVPVQVYKTDINGHKEVTKMRYNHVQGFWNTLTGTCKVTHWQPLPEPPKQ